MKYQNSYRSFSFIGRARGVGVPPLRRHRRRRRRSGSRLQNAIQRALEANLNVLEARTRTDEDQGAESRSQAALLPRVNAETYANYQNRDLRAFGISVPGLPLPNVVGPFSNYDFRIYAQQDVLDLSSCPHVEGQRAGAWRRAS